MKMRRNTLAMAVATALTVSVVPAAHAEITNTDQLSAATSAKLEGSMNSEYSSELGSSKTGNETWDNMHPLLKVFVGVLSATAVVTAFGILRTIVFNLFHV